MKTISVTNVFILLLHLPQFGLTQEVSSKELPYQIKKIYPYISISKTQLEAAKTLLDLNKRYKPSWVRSYLSVEVFCTYQGQIQKVVGKNNVLTSAQKEAMEIADSGTDIIINVRYIPENNLEENEAKELDFTLVVEPQKDAQFYGGSAHLDQYLFEEAIQKIPTDTFKGYDLAAVTFTVDAEGVVGDASIFESSKNDSIDELLLATIRAMPCWRPAAYADGTKVKQEFVLTVGNMENCMLHTLNLGTP